MCRRRPLRASLATHRRSSHCRHENFPRAALRLVQPGEKIAHGQLAFTDRHRYRHHSNSPQNKETEVGLMTALLEVTPATTAADPDSFQRYYAEAGPDYAACSPYYNMHFGFYQPGMSPFNREAMLEEMNRQVLHRLHVENKSSASAPARILDMGCGL